MAPLPISAFVFLDTSSDKPVKSAGDSSFHQAAPGILIGPDDGKGSAEKSREQSRRDTVSSGSHLPHFGNVLFLSADSKVIYAYIGVLKALEEYGLDFDLILSESKATLVGASWALGYSAAKMEKRMLENPLEDLLKPMVGRKLADGQIYDSDVLAPLQWHIPLVLPSLQASTSIWEGNSYPSGNEYLQLSWMVAKLTHDAPAGPVEDLAATPKPLAIKVVDLSTDQEDVITEGSLQNLLKGALLPPDIVRKRNRLWPFASGTLLSGHKVMAGKLPFTFDRMIIIQAGPHLHPGGLDEIPLSWIDSLNQRRELGSDEFSLDGTGPDKIMRIELEPEGNFDPVEPDPKKWIELGYVSTLRSMDILRSALSGEPEASPALGSTPMPIMHASLGLNRVSVNSLASGGRQLLLDIIRTSENGEDDSVGDGSIAAITESGFYSDLDLEWTRAVGEERASLVFDAKDRSQLGFRAGWNMVLSQADLTDRGPEGYASLTWDEPFYIPFRSEAGVLVGSHCPGYEVRAMITPIYPIRLDLGLSATHWELLYPFPPSAVFDLDPLWFKIRRDLAEVFLKVYPTKGTYLRTSIRKHEMSVPNAVDPSEDQFLSTDFQETAFLGLGKAKSGGIHPHSLRFRYRNLNRVNLFGPVKYSTTSFEARLRFSLGDFRFSDQYFRSNQDTDDFTIYDVLESGHIEVFTFQDEYFLGALRASNFQDVKMEYCPVFGKAGLRLVAGAYRIYGSNFFFEDQVNRPLRKHWEAQAGYATPIGYLRAGLGGTDLEAPVYYLKIGSDLALGFGEAD